MAIINIKTSNNPLEKSLVDNEIEEFKAKLKTLKKTDLQIKEELDSIKDILDNDELKQCFNIIKLLYCINCKKQIYIYFGVIIESLLNTMACLYINANKDMKNSDGRTIDIQKEFINEPLSHKATKIIGFNLFQEENANKNISSLIQSIVPFRNYGGHSKYSSFIELCIGNELLTDDDCKICISIIRKINEASKILQSKLIQ